VAEFYKSSIPIIDVDHPTAQHTDMLHPKQATFGLVPRDLSKYPLEMFDSPDKMIIVPESEWDARFDEQEEQQSSLEHLYLCGPNGEPAFENLDQNGDGYCWAYSTGQSIMLDRLKRNLALVRLNPHATAAIIKKGRNEGGWCGLSAQFGREHGYAVEGTGPGQWPLHSRNLKYDTAQLRTEMAKYKIEEEWVDLTRSVYDQNLTRAQVASCGFNNIPGPGDYNWWGHSVCRVRWVRIERGSWGQLILNSWPKWGRRGLAVLRGNQAICDGALAVRLTAG
jgi:hypothetical protein